MCDYIINARRLLDHFHRMVAAEIFPVQNHRFFLFFAICNGARLVHIWVDFCVDMLANSMAEDAGAERILEIPAIRARYNNCGC